ncbi:MAG: GTPase domain-containing protein [Hyphomicrobiaceae bacterium]|nr:GTPase domain-containing protein [Hyphomicrobiaceae bacterium]
MIGWLPRLSGIVARQWSELWSAVLDPAKGTRESEAIAVAARRNATVVWLMGKVQSGKTSIVRALTGCTDAEIGTGYAPCTRTARIFEYPAEAPVIRFLDTRGLGETHYDPAEDLAFCESQTHLSIAVMKALDPQQEAIVSLVGGVRSRRPGWPVIVAQTSLHEGYPAGTNHPPHYAFEPGSGLPAADVPPELVRSLAFQRGLFEGLPGKGPVSFVPIDFTLPEDGFRPVNYGLDAFVSALQVAAPAGLVAVLQGIQSATGNVRSARAHPHVLGYATVAAAADAVPLAGLVAVPSVQAKMLHSLAAIYGVAWDRRTLREFASCFGTGALIRAASHLGIRQIVKLIPVYGQTAGAVAASAASFATTFALGKAACYFLARRRSGDVDVAGVAAVYSAALAEAFSIASRPAAGPAGPR